MSRACGHAGEARVPPVVDHKLHGLIDILGGEAGAAGRKAARP